MSKVLVTGASGFIGSHLVPALVAQGHEVHCLARPTANVSRLDLPRVRIVTGDVTQPESLAGAVDQIDVVFHLAGATMALRKADLFRVNEIGTRNLVTVSARQESPPTVVYLSSMAASGPTRTDRPRVETEPAMPVSHYGRSKLAGENVAREFASRVPITVLRPPVVFGEHDPYQIHMYRPIIRWGVHLGQGLRRNRFSMVHADDLTSALILAAQQGQRLAPTVDHRPAQGVYFVAADEHPLFDDWGRMIANAAGQQRLRVWSGGSGRWIWLAAVGSECVAQLRRRPAIFNLDKCREIRGGSWWCDDAAFRRDTGYRPAADLAARIRQTVDWYRAAGWL